MIERLPSVFKLREKGYQKYLLRDGFLFDISKEEEFIKHGIEYNGIELKIIK